MYLKMLFAESQPFFHVSMCWGMSYNNIFLASLFVFISVAVYSEPKGNMVCMFKGQQGGVTHIMFSPDGNLLYSGGRKVSW